MKETQVQFLGWEDPLEEAMETHSSILVWRIPIDKGTWRVIDTNEQLGTHTAHTTQIHTRETSLIMQDIENF